ncbi:MAG: DNA-binding transcriptional LysR family regulator [Sulfitobacter sp.]|jgi:DNA-binding transcriptional LysR family regulator
MEWLKAAKVFESVVHSGSLSAAARKLGLSPASVSRHVNDLESELGVRLLNRTSRRLSLTEAGRIYFDKVEAIVLQIADANNSVQQLTAVPRGVLRLHSRMLVGQQYIVPAIGRFVAQYPEIRVDLQMSNFPVDIVSQGVDIDIRIGKLADSSLVARKMATSRRLLVATPEYLARMPPIERPQDLKNHSCLSYRLNLGGSIWRFRKEGQENEEVHVKGVLQSDNGQAILSVCEEGLGIAMMNDWSVVEQLNNGSLIAVLEEYEISFTDFESGIYAVFQKSPHLPLKIRAFVDFMSAEFKSLLGQ